MSRKLVLTTILVSVLIGMLALSFKVQVVNTSGTIFIRANGSVAPEGTPISTIDNVTYIFTGNIFDEIIVEKDNIVVDGVGYTLQGTGNGCGLDLSFRSNVTIKNIEIKEFDFGIYFNHSVSNTITGNFLTAINFEGIRLYESSNNNITGNSIAVNDWDAVTLCGSSDNKIAENNFTSNYDGIRLYESSNNSIVENIVANNYYGIFLAVSSNNSIIKNNVTANNGNGISLVWSSNENRIVENLIMVNNWHGMHLNKSSNNIIYHNNFMDNTQQIDTNNSVNVWDCGYPSSGNFWSNFTGVDLKSGSYQNETGSDGIGDTAYIIDANNTDNYPLMGMFSDFTVSVPAYPTEGFEDVCIISNSTVSNLGLCAWLSSPNEYLQPGQLFIDFSVTGDNNTAGFCRITLPRRILNATSYCVIVNWQPVNVIILPFSNSTHDYLYFTYNHSTQEVIVTVLEFPSTLILPLFMVPTLLAVIIYKRKFSKKGY